MTTRQEKSPQDILAEYQKDVARWQERGQSYKDIQELKVEQVKFLQLVLHPTKKQASKDVTKALVDFICQKGICTAQEIFDALGYSDKPIMTRIRILMEFGLIRRQSKKWYIATPRIYVLQKRYLHRMCAESKK